MNAESDLYIINKAVINDADIYEVYNRIVDWSRKRKGTIHKENKPYYLEIVRTKQHKGYVPLGAGFYISLKTCDSYVEIKIKTSKCIMGGFGLFWNYYDGQDLELVEDIYRYIGVDVDEELLRSIYPKKYSNSLIIGSLFFSTVYLLGAIVIIQVSIVHFSSFASIFLFLFGLSFFFFFALPTIRELFRALRRR